jgi:hypothetical protein
MSLTKTNTELGNVKSDSTNTRIDLASKLEGIFYHLRNWQKKTFFFKTKRYCYTATVAKINNEMEKTNTNFSKIIYDFSKKLLGILFLKLLQKCN